VTKISVKVTSGGVTLEATGDVRAVNAQVERFLATVQGAPASAHHPGTIYDAIVTVLYRTDRPLTRAEIADELVRGGFKCPKNLPQALADTMRHKKYIDHARHGVWKLTDTGKARAKELQLRRQNKKG
jgi:hypothetical protein